MCVLLCICLCEDRAGRDKGCPVAVFTANSSVGEKLEKVKRKELNGWAPQQDISYCEKSPKGQERKLNIQRLYKA